ncbi:hypothetical protein N657DRAFT_664318 [Parathielavia appendiculata]|uniref:Zn(2)-C6 fungal-type domain-containing protein n=1 Tax=Parathielavia appendiculata TaxID=2587402 RepID=A0AAN6TZ24_9PEZI|nr:hypothetical protein N657DRAFT_664318 [Parathielavia appendiculata]
MARQRPTSTELYMGRGPGPHIDDPDLLRLSVIAAPRHPSRTWQHRSMSPSSPEDVTSEASAAAASSPAHEPLACVSCRSRKLKCDRQKPVCARCAKSNAECVYPESRRKPAFKRRNVRELEERLAQVEGLLKSVGKQRASQSGRSDGAWTEGSSPGSRPDRLQGSPREGAMPWIPLSPRETPRGGDHAQSPGELLGLGRFERLPPFEMIEELHTVFFQAQQLFMPIINPGNYLRAFHSPPHMRPPMSLQYAIWTAAANGHPKYGCYHDALYRRARQYLEADELKGAGEHFITVGHAQAWALVASDEARCLLFTRASMSSARCVRLAGMMGLHRLDSTLPEEDVPMAPMIAPPRNWAELEERRRLFWGGFCIDSYASISAGWPTLIDVDQITTHLPASEDAFQNGVEEKSATLHDAFRGANYSNFAANVLVCHIFARLMKHAHRPLPDDHPEDPENGAFWKRHRELDNMLSSTFMFLPERFRLRSNRRDPVAVQTNLNLHAAVICLHHAARDKADKFKLAGIRQSSRTRALTAAQEIVDIMKATGHIKSGHKGPLMALSLYLAATVYTAQAKENPDDFNRANLELLVKWMNIVGHHHIITRSYLNQILVDIERNGISVTVEERPPNFDPNTSGTTACGHGIPLNAAGPSTWSFGQGQTFVDPAPDLFEYTGSGWSYTTKYMTNPVTTTTLPHRTGSPAIFNRGAQNGASNAMPNFSGFSAPGSTGAAGPSSFPQVPAAGPSTSGLPAAFGMNTTPTTNTTNTNLSPGELGDFGIFENLGEWGPTDLESLYAMVLDVSGGDTGTSQETIDPWATMNDAGGGAGSG